MQPQTSNDMWITLSLISAFLLGFYDIFKKKSVNANAIAPVLFFSTLVSALIFLPFILLSHYQPQWFSDGFLTNFYVESIPLKNHLLILGKAFMIMISWVFSYSAMKNLPITVVGPINQLRPAISLLLLLIVFQEHLTVNQWIGVVLAIVSFYLMNKSGKREGIKFESNKWVIMLLLSAVIVAISGIYDKFLLSKQHMAPVTVQSWYSVYLFILMTVFILCVWWKRRKEHPFEWRWSIVVMAVFVSVADCIYLSGLSQEAAIMVIIPLILNGVRLVVSFSYGALCFKEKNIRSKIIPLLMVLTALAFLCV